MRKKFKIYYCKNHPDPEKAGKRYKPTPQSLDMVVMNEQGVFFVFNRERYYPSLRELDDVIGNYDVRWIN